jgi:UDP-N-acetylglucosamine acyltransferase
MSSTIAETAIISSDAQLAPGVEVGPYAIIGPHVTIGAGSVVGPHVRIEGPTTIGERNRLRSGSATASSASSPWAPSRRT